MGLDMYLTKNRPGTDGCELLAYWRKANHVHGWFERNTSDGYIENCELYPVCRDDLVCLMSDCRKVLDDPGCAARVMPREDGFFFGSQAFDADYFDSLDETAEMVRHILEEVDERDELFYHAWW